MVDLRGQRRMDRLVRDDRKVRVSQITTHVPSKEFRMK